MAYTKLSTKKTCLERRTERVEAQLDAIGQELEGRSFHILSGGPSDSPEVKQLAREMRSYSERRATRVLAKIFSKPDTKLALPSTIEGRAQMRAAETAAWKRRVEADLARPRRVN